MKLHPTSGAIDLSSRLFCRWIAVFDFSVKLINFIESLFKGLSGTYIIFSIWIRSSLVLLHLMIVAGVFTRLLEMLLLLSKRFVVWFNWNMIHGLLLKIMHLRVHVVLDNFID